MDNFPITLRYLEEADKNFIISSWARSLRDKDTGDPTYNHPEDGYWYWRHIDGAIKNTFKICKYIVACDPEDPDHIFGYICYDGDIINYVYVKQPYRRMHIALRLIREVTESSPILTHFCTKSGKEMARHSGLHILSVNFFSEEIVKC